MNPKSLLWLSITALLIASLVPIESLALTKTETVSPTTVIYVDPPISAKEVNETGQEFTVAIKVANVHFLYSWRFDLEWDPNLLEVPDDPGTPGIVEGVSEGSFLNQEGEFDTIFTARSFSSKISVTSQLKGVAAYDAPSGSGTLATVAFLLKAEGECLLHFNFTRLLIFEGITPPPVEVPHVSEDGYFKYPLSILSVEPSSIMDSNLVPGSSFTVNITVARVTDLYAWDFFLNWDPALLNATNVTEGPFLKSAGTTAFRPPEINQTEGYLHANCTLTEGAPGASDNGTIATITFLVEAKGQTYLSLTLPRPPLPDIDETLLFDSEKASIRHATENCLFMNLLRDIAVTKIEASPTTVKAGDSVTINVTVKNWGFIDETLIAVSVTTPCPPSPGYVLIGTQTILSLEPDQETTLTFIWNTKNVDTGEYTIRAEASTVPEEIDTADNVLDMDGTVKVTSPEQLPTTLIIAVIIAIAVIAMAIFLYTRRKS
ncbi:MAG: cohesin domain-containing protein [Candidatus Bathyarchaeota archaeon]|nr:cohesin domain-containing protein [Candidatus Bathyarchaeota archaeon]